MATPVLGLMLKMSRPTYNVVEGPAGTSVGNRINTTCPMVVTVIVPSGLYVCVV